MEKYNVFGMSCAACSSRVEKAVSGLENVTACSVNLLTNSMTVEGTADSMSIIAAVSDAGYRAEKSGGAKTTPEKETDEERELKKVRSRLILSAILLVVLMYFSMGKMMFNLPLGGIFEENIVANGILQMLLSGVIMVINGKFFVSAYKSIRHRAPNMDALVSLGSATSFIYSVCILLMASDAMKRGDAERLSHLSHEFYFESAAMILTLITVGKMLEAFSKGKTTNAIKSLMDLSPKTAVVIRDGKEMTISATQLVIGDIFLVHPGKSISADGVVIEGESSVDESALTGESMPVYKEVGSSVSAATINQSGFLRCRATGVGEDTTLSKIIKMVSDASSEKAPVAKIADKVSGIFVPVVMGIALITAIVWLLLGQSVGFSLQRAVCVLVISCPCALGLATPVAIMVGNGVGAKKGVLFKTAVSLENCGRAKTVALDKTGTVTKGEGSVTDVVCAENTDREYLLSLAYSLEKGSEHPLAKAIIKKCEEEKIFIKAVSSFKVFTGSGISGEIDGMKIHAGNRKFIESILKIPAKMEEYTEKFSEEGKTPVIIAGENEVFGVIAVADTLKEDSAEAIAQLKKLGIRTVMLTGDNEKTARHIADLAGIDTVFAQTMPGEKEALVRSLRNEGTVLMVGDGINDAPALTTADVGIAIGAGTDIAMESADVVLSGSSLYSVVTAIKLSRATLRNIHQNLFWAFFYNVIGIPLAAGVWIPITGWKLSPMFGAAAMSLSSVCVITNALRLNFFGTNKKEKVKKMEMTIKIEGMMCPHCEARVKQILEDTDGVAEALVSHKNGEAIVKMNREIPFETLRTVIEAQGYKVL